MTNQVKIGVIANTDKPLAQKTLGDIAKKAQERGFIIMAEESTISLASCPGPWLPCTLDEMASARVVIVLGGDGTLLRAVHSLADIDVPVMGLNIGSLGYLSGVGSNEVDMAFDAIANDALEISKRQMLTATINRANGSSEQIKRDALNELVLSRGSGRMVRISMELDGVPVMTYACDGLIASTPTGSTAYSLSAGGPLVMPGTAATVITVICPHALASRPIVVADNTRITLRPIQGETPLILTIDGEELATISCGDTLDIHKATRSASIAFPPEHNNYQVLSRKLGWTGTCLPNCK